MKVAIYARVSTRDQNPDLQLWELRDYCRARGWSIVAEYVDRGASGASESRPALNDLLRDVTRRKFQTVLVWKFDRFARSVHQLLDSLRLFQGLGVDFVSVTEQLDTTTPVGKMVFTVLGALAAFERDLLIERTRAGIDRARAAGKHCGRPPGPAIDRNQIVALRAQNLSYREIAEKLGCSPALVCKAMRESVRKGLAHFVNREEG